jgi:hypothetical protein
MRCISCDCRLTDYEATRKSAVTGEYLDMCNRCFSSISDQVLTIDRPDLIETDDIEKELDNYEE